jgi:hypothetical protein
VFLAEIVDYGGRRGNAMRALTQWQHLVASIEAWDVLHWEMRPTSHRCIRMAIEITSNLPAFLVVADSLLPTNIAK